MKPGWMCDLAMMHSTKHEWGNSSTCTRAHNCHRWSSSSGHSNLRHEKYTTKKNLHHNNSYGWRVTNDTLQVPSLRFYLTICVTWHFWTYNQLWKCPSWQFIIYTIPGKFINAWDNWSVWIYAKHIKDTQMYWWAYRYMKYWQTWTYQQIYRHMKLLTDMCMNVPTDILTGIWMHQLRYGKMYRTKSSIDLPLIPKGHLILTSKCNVKISLCLKLTSCT